MLTKTLIYIAGPTGVGKTKLSLEIAKLFDTDIISCVSLELKNYVIERSGIDGSKVFVNHCLAGSNFNFNEISICPKKRHFNVVYF